jgi:release factor glutamine methyltransferase
MVTILNTYQHVKTSLENIYNVREAENIATLLLCYIFNLQNKIDLYEKGQRDVNVSTEKLLAHKLKRLMRHEPIQHVIHKTWFYGLELYVNRNTLIPRPETEEMIQTIIAENVSSALNVIDIATGSGCIALALKKNRPEWKITATDISENALNVAKCNSKKEQLSIQFLHDDIFNSVFFQQERKFDIIVSNPPYIPYQEKESMNKNVVLFEPSLALFVPDEHPLIFYASLIKLSKKCLTENGCLYAEIHELFAHDIELLFQQSDFSVHVYNDLNNKPRYIKAAPYGQR